MGDRFLSGESIREGRVAGRFYRGLGPGPRPGVLVLHGGGGAGGYEREYAAMLAEHGYVVLCVEYFGAPGVPDALAEIPLERFEAAADWLLDRGEVAGDRVAVVGFSRGGEAALLVGARFDSVGGVVAYVPGAYVTPAPSWMDGVGENVPTWTHGGDPVPFLPVDGYVRESDDVGEPLGQDPNPLALALRRSDPGQRRRAAIAVEEIDGPVLLVSGGEDTVWPSATFGEHALDRLERHDHPWRHEHRSYPGAGHAIRVPYRFEAGDSPDRTHQFGGTVRANARASADAWTATLQYLRIARTGRSR